MTTLNINGNAVDVSGENSRFLLYVLRDELGMTGTKFGCGGGFCGACTVQVDGIATRSCITPVNTVVGKSIRTIEDLAVETPDGMIMLHPVQQAFIDEQVPQCSWCMSGQMMTALSFLEENSKPTDEEIVQAMGDNYCRCGCYVRIKSAVRRASELMEQQV
jgi:isoquinoline 1-oxidoreductase alpha subunit